MRAGRRSMRSRCLSGMRMTIARHRLSTAHNMTACANTCQALDRLVGRNIRAQRIARGLSQTALGRAVSVTFQQVQKYENGKTKISAARLYLAAQLLDVPLASFFEGLTDMLPAQDAATAQSVGEARAAAKLMQCYLQIPN